MCWLNFFNFFYLLLDSSGIGTLGLHSGRVGVVGRVDTLLTAHLHPPFPLALHLHHAVPDLTDHDPHVIFMKKSRVHLHKNSKGNQFVTGITIYLNGEKS